jgi:hypothetical protein
LERGLQAAKKAEIYSKTYQTAMFTRHAMCEAQVDFGDVSIVRRNKSEENWHILVLSFPWSNAGFAYLCRNETKECLCEGLQRIFEYIGGVPLRILFDNMSSAVVHIEAHGERTLTDMFMRFCQAACPPAKPAAPLLFFGFHDAPPLQSGVLQPRQSPRERQCRVQSGVHSQEFHAPAAGNRNR